MPGLCLPPFGQHLQVHHKLQVHHLIPERSGGIFGHVSRPGSQDNMRISRFEFKTHFADQKYLHSLDGGECCQKRCLQIKSNRFYCHITTARVPW